MFFTPFRTVLMAMLLACAVLPVACADSKNAVGVNHGQGSSRSSSLMQTLSSFFWATSTMGYIKATNVEAPDGVTNDQLGMKLTKTFNIHLREHVKAQGDPTKTAVIRAWSPSSGTMLMELQSAAMAEYAVRVLPRLTVARNMDMQIITAADVEAEGIVVCAWQRRQRFIIQLSLLLAAFFGIRQVLASGLPTFDRKASKMTLPFHGASVVEGSSSFQANQHTSCVARKAKGSFEI